MAGRELGHRAHVQVDVAFLAHQVARFLRRDPLDRHVHLQTRAYPTAGPRRLGRLAVTRRSEPRHAFRERRRRRQQAQHQVGLAREIEEVAGMDEDAVAARRASSTHSSSLRVAGTCTTADHPPSTSSTVAGVPAAAVRSAAEVGPDAVADRRLQLGEGARARRARRAARAWTRRGRCRPRPPGGPVLPRAGPRARPAPSRPA